MLQVGDRTGNAVSPRVWLYVDDQLQQMEPHGGPWPQPQPQGPSRLLLGGLPDSSSDSIGNFSGCISNVFMLR